MFIGRFMQPVFLRKFKVGKRTKFDVENFENYLSNDNMFIGIPKNSLELLFEDWDKRNNSVISS